MGFVYVFLYFVVVDNAITLFNYFFRDFRGFRDFRVFDLAESSIVSKVISISTSLFVNAQRQSNLFLIEFILI